MLNKKHKIIQSQDMCLTLDSYNFGVVDDRINNGRERTKLQKPMRNGNFALSKQKISTPDWSAYFYLIYLFLFMY